MRSVSEPVHQDVQTKPNHIHKVPIPSSTFKTKVTVGGEVALLQAECDEQQHQHAQEHMEAVEACQHEKGRAINARCQLEVELLVRVVVLIALETQECHAKQHGHPHEQNGFATVVFTQSMVGNGDGHT